MKRHEAPLNDHSYTKHLGRSNDSTFESSWKLYVIHIFYRWSKTDEEIHILLTTQNPFLYTYHFIKVFDWGRISAGECVHIQENNWNMLEWISYRRECYVNEIVIKQQINFRP